ncbi:HigA family addiction module antitoxin [Specibacter cremeus]|uniref:HigA family addiction module antitoxin n=1 Tax=Specibacter cremeus TaxID=1629051 RepID=UPI000F7B5107
MLDAAETLDDLRVPPGDRLEALRGDRVGQHGIRVNQRWRIGFVWTEAGPDRLEIVDYHQEVARMDRISPIHSGEVLMDEFLDPLGVTPHRLAIAVGVPPRRINEIVHGKRRITVDTALRLARFFGTTDRFWLNLQTRYVLEIERDNLGSALDAITPLESA